MTSSPIYDPVRGGQRKSQTHEYLHQLCVIYTYEQDNPIPPLSQPPPSDPHVTSTNSPPHPCPHTLLLTISLPRYHLRD